MKTMKAVLIAAVLLAGTSGFAQRNKEDNNRQKKESQKTEVRSENKKSNNRSENRRTEVRVENNRPEVRSDNRRVEVRNDTRRPEVRNENNRTVVRNDNRRPEVSNDNRRVEVRNNNSRAEVRNDTRRPEVRNDNRRPEGQVRYSVRSENRNPDNNRYEQYQNSRNRYRNNDRFEGRNNHSYDNRPRIYATYNRYQHEACPLCYGPRMHQGFGNRYSVSDMAWMETDRIAMALDLSDRQIDEIYTINFRYLSQRSGSRYNSLERRERSIRNVLSYSQRRYYDNYLDQMNEGEFCENCNDGWDNGNFRVAFQLNL